MQAATKQTSIANRLLAALPRSEFERLAPHLEQIKLPTGTLYDAGVIINHAYFLQSGMISLLSVTNKDQVIEVGAVGDEGMVGIPTVLRNRRAPLRVVVQIPITALRIPAESLRREFSRCGKLQEVVLCYTHALVTQISQSVACNRYHTVEQRLSRWLLMTRDCAHSDTFYLTHEFISYMLGTTRSIVTTAALTLQEAGLIRYRRGKITIHDGNELEAVTCGCYRLIREENECFLSD
jgi:CRP-like cAMP-binding protein